MSHSRGQNEGPVATRGTFSLSQKPAVFPKALAQNWHPAASAAVPLGCKSSDDQASWPVGQDEWSERDGQAVNVC